MIYDTQREHIFSIFVIAVTAKYENKRPRRSIFVREEIFEQVKRISKI